jgi:putative addiction module killer protein
MRIDYGPGNRVYYLTHGNSVVVLLAGGNKSTQSRDIEKAVKLARELKKEA